MFTTILKEMFGNVPEEVPDREDALENQNIGEDLDEEAHIIRFFITNYKEFRIRDGEEFITPSHEDIINYFDGLEEYPPANPNSLIIQRFQNGIFPEHLKVTFGFDIRILQR